MFDKAPNALLIVFLYFVFFTGKVQKMDFYYYFFINKYWKRSFEQNMLSRNQLILMIAIHSHYFIIILIIVVQKYCSYIKSILSKQPLWKTFTPCKLWLLLWHGLGPWTLDRDPENLDLVKPLPWKTWTLKNMDLEKYGKRLHMEKWLEEHIL